MSESATLADYSELLGRVAAPEGTGRAIPDAATGEIIGRAPVHSVADLDGAVTAVGAQPVWAALGTPTAQTAPQARRRRRRVAEALAHLLSRAGQAAERAQRALRGRRVRGWLRATRGHGPAEVLVDESGTHAEIRYRPIGIVGAISPGTGRDDRDLADRPVAADGQYGRRQALASTRPSGSWRWSTPQRRPARRRARRRHGRARHRRRTGAQPGIGKVMFTGSTATGKIITASADTITRLTLELGGNDAGIVLPDVDPQGHRRGPVLGRVHQHRPDLRRAEAPVRARRLYDAVVEALADLAAKMPMGGAPTRRTCSARCRTRCSSTSSTPRRGRQGRGARVVLGGDPDYGRPATSTPSPSSPTSTTAPSWSRGAVRARPADRPVQRRRRRGRRANGPRSAWAPRCGRRTGPRRSPSRAGWRPAPSGSTATAACTRSSVRRGQALGLRTRVRHRGPQVRRRPAGDQRLRRRIGHD